MTTTCTVEITSDDDGELFVEIKHAGSSETDRDAVAFALRAAADMVEEGKPLAQEWFA